MILNDALYLISAGRRGGKFNQILIRKDDGTCVYLDGNDLDGLIEKNVYETKELLSNELLELGCSMGEEGEEDYDHEWHQLYDELMLLDWMIDDVVEQIDIESVEEDNATMYIELTNKG